MAFVAVGFDTTESLSKLADYQARNEYPWAFASAPREVAVEYSVRVQSTKFGIGPDGVIEWRAEYGTNDAGVWEQRFQQLLP